MKEVRQDMDRNKIVEAARKGAEACEKFEIEKLKAFSRIDCGTGNEAGNKKAVAIVDEMLHQIKGIVIEHKHFPGYGDVVVGRLKPEHPTGKIILNAHTDTVFKEGDAVRHPFHVEEDRAYGLGIADCKGGIIVAIHAVKIMQDAGLLPDKEIVFIFNCDEEVGSPVGTKVFEEELPNTEMFFAFEPARLENGVLTARKSSCIIKVDVKGKQAHAGVNYSEGRSAITEVAHIIQRFYESNIDERGIQFNCGPVVNDDVVNIVSGHATATLGVRVACQADIDTVRAIVQKINDEPPYIEGVEKKVFIEKMKQPMERNDKNVALYKKVYEAGKLLGYELPEQSSGGSGDANFFSGHGVASVDALGPYMYKIHSTEESMRLSSMKEKTELFAVVLGTLS